MKRIGILLALCLWSGAMHAEDVPSSDAQPRSPFLGGFIKGTRVVYPLRFRGWEAQGEHLYDAQELGASVRFIDSRHPDRWLDVYFYPAGVLDAEGFDAAMQRERDALAAAARPGASYTDMEIGETRQFVYKPRGADGKRQAKTTGYSLDLQMARDGIALHSGMTLQLDRLYYVKLRMSTPAGDLSRDAIRRQLEKFATGLADRLEIVSTGECWRPTDRAVPGCEAGEELDRLVPEGMRELRLEYWARDRGDVPVSTPPLRAPRTSRG